MTSSLFAAALFRALFLPPALFFTLLALAWAIGLRSPRADIYLRRATLVLAYVFSTPAGADLLVAPLEGMTTPLRAGAGRNAQAIVVLGAGRMRGPEYGNLSIPDYVALARLRYAARLQHETGLPILVSGGGRFHDGNPAVEQSLGEGMARALREDFRTPVAWIEDRSETTLDNAVLSRRILKAHDIDRILLVTDAMAMPRAAQVFARAGFQVIEAPTVFMWHPNPDALVQIPLVSSLFPSTEGLRQSYYAAYEWVGIAWYRLRGVI